MCGYACSTWFYIARVRFQWEVRETHEFHLARFALWLFTCKYRTENCSLNVVKYYPVPCMGCSSCTHRGKKSPYPTCEATNVSCMGGSPLYPGWEVIPHTLHGRQPRTLHGRQFPVPCMGGNPCILHGRQSPEPCMGGNPLYPVWEATPVPWVAGNSPIPWMEGSTCILHQRQPWEIIPLPCMGGNPCTLHQRQPL